MLIQYVVWRFTYSKVVAKTVSTEISGIISYLKRSCVSHRGLNRDDMYVLGCLLRGYRKLRPSIGSKAALTDNLLKKMIKNLKNNDVDDAVLRTALIFKKCLVLRNSEGWTWKYGKTGILVKDLNFLRKNGKFVGVVLNFKHSKTNQLGKDEFALAPCVCAHEKLCAVHALFDLIKLKEKSGVVMGPESHVFAKSNGKLLKMTEIARGLKQLCVDAGMDAKAFAPHSLRKGGATDYIAWGIPVEIVKEMGRWAAIESMDPYRQLDAIATVGLTMKRMNDMFSNLKLN